VNRVVIPKKSIKRGYFLKKKKFFEYLISEYKVLRILVLINRFKLINFNTNKFDFKKDRVKFNKFKIFGLLENWNKFKLFLIKLFLV
jgi:hypothetical protein